MTEGLWILLGVLGGLFVIPTTLMAYGTWSWRRTRETWGEAGDRLGLTHKAAEDRRAQSLEGVLDGFPVAIVDPGDGFGVQVTMDLSEVVPQDLGLIHPLVFKRQLRGEIEPPPLGDPTFDAKLIAFGATEHRLAYLDRGARREALKVIGGFGAILAGGQLVLDRQVQSARNIRRVVEIVERMLGLAKALQAPGGDPPARLKAHAEETRDEELRAAIVEALGTRWPLRDEALEAARLAHGDSDPRTALLEALRREDLPRALAAAKVPPAWWVAGLDVLWQRDPQASFALMEQLLERLVGASGDVTQRAIWLVEASGWPGAEATLLALTRRPELDVRLAAIRALGEVGSLSAVERLMAVGRGMLTAREVRQAARAAVEAIQARHAHGEAGSLSVVGREGDPESGRLSES